MLATSDMKFAVIGTGVIGSGWAVIFARHGGEVRLYDASRARAEHCLTHAAEVLRELAGYGLIDDPDAAVARLKVAPDLAHAVAGADYLQESIVEHADVKARFFASLTMLGEQTIVASSTSAIDPEEIFAGLPFADRCLVAHPFNPPYLMPVVEMLRVRATSDTTYERTCNVLTGLGMSPLLVHKAVPGFVINRLQAAVINEAMYLVGQGVVEPDAIDRCIADGLGLRWAFLGPFGTMDLNAPAGIAEYMEKFGHAYQGIGSALGVDQPWTEAAKQTVVEARRAVLPAAQLDAARRKRDKSIAALLQLRARLG